MVQHARRRKGFSQRELAEKVGMPQSTVARIESGAVDPRSGTLIRLLRACGEDLEALPRIGIGVDRSLIREMLKLSPGDRLRHAVAAGRNIAELTGVARRAYERS